MSRPVVMSAYLAREKRPAARTFAFDYDPPERRAVLLVGADGMELRFWTTNGRSLHPTDPHARLDAVGDLVYQRQIVTKTTVRGITKRQRRHEARFWTRGRRGARRVPMTSAVTGYVTRVKTALSPSRGLEYQIDVEPCRPPITAAPSPRSAPGTPRQDRPAPSGSSPSPA